MISAAAKHNLLFKQEFKINSEFPPNPNGDGEKREEKSRLGHDKRNISRENGENPVPMIHKSVLNRMAQRDDYNPPNLQGLSAQSYKVIESVEDLEID